MTAEKNRPVEDEAASKAFGGARDESTGVVAPLHASAGVVAAANLPLKVLVTVNEIIAAVTKDYLDRLDVQSPPAPAVIERELLARTNAAFISANTERGKSDQIAPLRSLTFTQVAEVMLRLHHVVKIQAQGTRMEESALLGVYMDSGPDEGTYVCDDVRIRAVGRRYNNEMTSNMFKEVMEVLRERAPWVRENEDRDIIAVGNGLFHYGRKELMPFTPEVVVRSKTPVCFDAEAENPVIDTPDGDAWDVETWMASLHDDADVIDALWQVTGALIRPNTSWNKSAWYYSQKGNNGKGTLVELQRALCGAGRHVSIQLADLGKDFMLEPLICASAIITDENDVGTFIDKAANLKAIITNDVLMVNRKHKMPLTYTFPGFMVQCLNGYPRVKDKTDSFYRRQLWLPFTKWFGEVGPDGEPIERTYIKDDYVTRPEVLRYVLKRVLTGMPDYYKLSVPEASKHVLDEFKVENDWVREWWARYSTEFVWDLLPAEFLADHYKAWVQREKGRAVEGFSRNAFLADVLRAVSDLGGWSHPTVEKTRVGDRMTRVEPSVADLGLERWVLTDRTGRPDWTRPKPVPANYRWCLVREGMSPLEATLRADYEEAKVAYEEAHARWVRHYEAKGGCATTYKSSPSTHADLALMPDGALSCCPRRTTDERQQAAADQAIVRRYNAAMDLLVANGYTL